MVEGIEADLEIDTGINRCIALLVILQAAVSQFEFSNGCNE